MRPTLGRSAAMRADTVKPELVWRKFRFRLVS
jgi:hypothetical protein